MIKNKVFFFCITLLMGVVAFSCTRPVATSNVPVSPSDAVVETNETTTPINIPSPIETSQSPTSVYPTPTQLITNTYLYHGKPVPMCNGEGKVIQPPDGFGIQGVVVYQSPSKQGLFTIGGTPLTLSTLPSEKEQEYYVFGFSPDGKWLAYTPVSYGPDGNPLFDKLSSILLSSTGKTIKNTLDSQELDDQLWEDFSRKMFGFPSLWINDDLIRTSRIVQNPGLGSGTIFALPEIFDPFHGEWREDLLNELPDRYTTGEVGFSPDLTRALYETNAGIVLRDLVNEKELWSDASYFAPWGITIQWSPDSSMALVVNKEVQGDKRQYFLIDRDGLHQQVIVDATFPYPEYQINDLHWSPNGQYIALSGFGDPSLFVFNVTEAHFVYFCPIHNASIVWSPDSNQIAYSYRGGGMYVLDLKSGEAVELVKDGLAVGWSDEFPVEWP